MKFQNKYQTNADYYSSYERLSQSPLITKLNQSRKGHINFQLKGAKGFGQLFVHGNLLIVWDNEEEKRRFYSLLPEVLVTDDGSELIVEPIDSTVYNIQYDTRFFQLVWCSSKKLYMTPYELFRRFLEVVLLGSGFLFFSAILLGFGIWLSAFLSFVLVGAYTKVISGKEWFRKLDKALEEQFDKTCMW